jgi:hypothetical protein
MLRSESLTIANYLHLPEGEDIALRYLHRIERFLGSRGRSTGTSIEQRAKSPLKNALKSNLSDLNNKLTLPHELITKNALACVLGVI